MTRRHKRSLTKDQRRKFRSCMWEYRTKPTRGAEPSPELQKLFDAIPELGELYYYRWELTEIFDTAPSRRAAARHIAALRARMSESTLDLSAFWETFDCWKDGILAYFDEGKNSGVVEGINNKARVVTKRAYGLKSAESLWTRLILDLNHAADVIGHSLQHIRELVAGIRAKFAAYYT